MSDAELLLKKVAGLPPDYMTTIFDFIDQLTHKAPPVKKLPTSNPYKAIEELSGFGLKKGSTLTVDRFLAMRHEETGHEEAEYRRTFRHEGE
jgi:hypothetical protein